MFILRKNRSEKLRALVFDRLSESKIPISEIVTDDVYFTDKVTKLNSIYIYNRWGKYYIKILTYHKAETDVHCSVELDDTVYYLVCLQMWRKAIHECGNQYKNYYLELIKQIDEKFYCRAVNEWDRTHL